MTIRKTIYHVWSCETNLKGEPLASPGTIQVSPNRPISELHLSVGNSQTALHAPEIRVEAIGDTRMDLNSGDSTTPSL